MKKLLVAVYVDLENIPKDLSLDKLMEELVLRDDDLPSGSEPIFAVKLACGEADAISRLRVQLVQHNFDIRETPHLSNKKNRADLILSLEAFESLYIRNPSIDRYVFVTSDSDFTVVMDKLRKYGREVWLVTRRQDCDRPVFNNSCDDLLVLEDYLRDRKNDVKEDKSAVDKSTIGLDARAIEIMRRVSESLDPDTWYVNAIIGKRFRSLDKGFNIKATSFGGINKLVTYLSKMGVFEIGESDKGAPQVRINDLSKFDSIPKRRSRTA